MAVGTAKTEAEMVAAWKALQAKKDVRKNTKAAQKAFIEAHKAEFTKFLTTYKG